MRGRVVVIDTDGSEAWSHDLPGDYCDAALGDGPNVIDLSALPATDLGDGTVLQTVWDDLYRIDTRTGRATAVAPEDEPGTYVTGVEVVGEHLVLSTADGVFVLERED